MKERMDVNAKGRGREKEDRLAGTKTATLLVGDGAPDHNVTVFCPCGGEEGGGEGTWQFYISVFHTILVHVCV